MKLTQKLVIATLIVLAVLTSATGIVASRLQEEKRLDAFVQGATERHADLRNLLAAELGRAGEDDPKAMAAVVESFITDLAGNRDALPGFGLYTESGGEIWGGAHWDEQYGKAQPGYAIDFMSSVEGIAIYSGILLDSEMYCFVSEEPLPYTDPTLFRVMWLLAYAAILIGGCVTVYLVAKLHKAPPAEALPVEEPVVDEVSDGRAFVEMAAHELRQPVAAIQHYADRLGSGTGDDTPDLRKRMTNFIYMEARRVQALPQSLVRLAELSGAAPDLPFVLLDGVLKDAARSVIPEVPEEVDVRLKPGAGVEVKADHDLLAELVRNMILGILNLPPVDNTLWVRWTQEEGNRCRIEVSDREDTPGDNTADRILADSFWSWDPEGIAQQLCERIAAYHGGELTLSCGGDGEGMVLSITLPAKSPAPNETQTESGENA